MVSVVIRASDERSPVGGVWFRFNSFSCSAGKENFVCRNGTPLKPKSKRRRSLGNSSPPFSRVNRRCQVFSNGKSWKSSTNGNDHRLRSHLELIFFQRYASLYFCCGIEQDDNELITLETIHRYVELLDKYFGSVSTRWCGRSMMEMRPFA